MANVPIGEALIEIQPDFTEFQKKLDKELKKALKKAETQTNLELKTDVTALERDLARGVARAISRAESGTNAQIEIEPDLSNFANQVSRELRNQLGRIAQDASIELQAEIDTKTINKSLSGIDASNISDSIGLSDIGGNLNTSELTGSLKTLSATVATAFAKLTVSVDKLNLNLEKVAITATSAVNPATAETGKQLTRLSEISDRLNTPFKNLIQIFGNVTEGFGNIKDVISRFQEASQAAGTGFDRLRNGVKLFLGIGDQTTGQLQILNNTVDGTVQKIVTLESPTGKLVAVYDQFGRSISVTTEALVNLNTALSPDTITQLDGAIGKAGENTSKLAGDFISVNAALQGINPEVLTGALVSTADGANTATAALAGTTAAADSLAEVAGNVGEGSTLQLFNPADLDTLKAVPPVIKDIVGQGKELAKAFGEKSVSTMGALAEKAKELAVAAKDKAGQALGTLGKNAEEVTKSELKLIDATKQVNITLSKEVNAWTDVSSVANKSVDAQISKQKELAAESKKTADAIAKAAEIGFPTGPAPKAAGPSKAPPPPPGAPAAKIDPGSEQAIKAASKALEELKKKTDDAGDAALDHFMQLQKERTGLSGVLDAATKNAAAARTDIQALKDKSAALKAAAAEQGLFGGALERARAIAIDARVKMLSLAAGLKEVGAQGQTGGTGLIAFGVGVQRIRDKLDSLKQQAKDVKTALAGVGDVKGGQTDLASKLFGESKGILAKANTFKTALGSIEGGAGKAKFGIDAIGQATSSFLPKLGSLGGGLGGVTGKLGQMAAATGPVGAALAGATAAAVALGLGITKVADKITSFANISAATGESINAVAVQLGAMSGTFNGFDDALTKSREGIKLTAAEMATLEDPSNAAAVSFLNLANNARNFGLTAGQLTQAVTPIAAQLKQAGLGGEDLSTGIGQLSDRAIDLASVFNVDVNTVLGKFGAALRGETDPVESLGISFKGLDVDLKAAALGFQKINGEFPETAKQAARFSLLLEKSEQNAGDFAKTLGTSLPNQQRVFASTLQSFKEDASSAFLPAAIAIQQVKTNLLNTFGPSLVKLIKGGAVAAKAFADAFAFLANIGKIVGTQFIGIITDIQKLFKALDPVIRPIITLLKGLAVLSFAPLVSAILTFTTALRVTIQAVTLLVNIIKTGLIAAFNVLKPIAATAFDGLKVGIQAVIGFVQRLASFLKPLLPVFITIGAISLAPLILALGAVVGVVKLVQANAEALGNFFSGLGDRIARGFGKGVDFIKQVIEDIKQDFNNLVEDIKNILGGIGEFFSDLGQSIADTFGGIVEPILAPFRFIADQVGNIFESVFSFVKGTIGRLVGAVSRIPGVGKLVGGLKGALDGLGDFDLGDTLKGGLDKAGQSAQFFKGRIDDLKGAFTGGKAGARDFKTELEALQKQFDTSLTAANGLVSAQEALNNAQKAVADIDKQAAALNAEKRKIAEEGIAKSAKEQLEAKKKIRDIDKELRELAQAREQAAHDEAIRQREFGQEQEAFADRLKLADLDIAQAKREAEEAQKAINAAVKEGVEEETPSVNLAGLNLDQIRAKLANVRATLAAQKAGKKVATDENTEGKSKLELEEAATRAAIAARDAERSRRDLLEGQDESIRNNGIAAREFAEQQQEFAERERELNEQKKEAQKELNELLRGETKVKEDIKKLDEQLKALADQRKTAVQAVAQAELGVQRAIAVSKGDTAEINRLDSLILQKKADQLGKNQLISAELQRQVDLQRQLLSDGAAIAAQQKVAEQRMKAIASLNEEIARALAFERDNGQFSDQRNRDSGARESGRQKLESFIAGLRPFAQLTGGRAGPVNLSNQFIRELSEKLIDSPSSDLIGLLRDLLKRAGIEVPNLYSGGIVEGAPGPMGRLIRAGEYGRAEAVLPLSRPAQMADLLSMPRILNPVLAALPRMSLEGTSRPTLIQAAAPTLVTARAASASSRNFGGRGSEQEKKKERLALADAIAEAIVSRGGAGTTVEVNAPISMTAPTENIRDRKLAREIKKSIEKYL